MGRSVGAEADARKTSEVTCGRVTGGTDSMTVSKHKLILGEKRKKKKKGGVEGSYIYTGCDRVAKISRNAKRRAGTKHFRLTCPALSGYDPGHDTFIISPTFQVTRPGVTKWFCARTVTVSPLYHSR